MIRRVRQFVSWSLWGASFLGLAALTGCDEYGYGGDYYVEPMDFSPYGYDYDMYDIFTSDL
ncbi:MAG: hypothetical protein AMXMBFR13_11850 [Phycisphaerae bacterium]